MENYQNYAIAYANQDGSDFHGKPWLEDGFSTTVAAEAKRLKWVSEKNIKKSFVFILPEKHPEEISWEYAEKNQVCFGTKVVPAGWGTLKDAEGNIYSDDGSGEGGVMNHSTGELFWISKRDENENPVEIMPLHDFEAVIEKVMAEVQCNRLEAERLFGRS